MSKFVTISILALASVVAHAETSKELAKECAHATDITTNTTEVLNQGMCIGFFEAYLDTALDGYLNLGTDNKPQIYHVLLSSEHAKGISIIDAIGEFNIWAAAHPEPAHAEGSAAGELDIMLLKRGYTVLRPVK